MRDPAATTEMPTRHRIRHLDEIRSMESDRFVRRVANRTAGNANGGGTVAAPNRARPIIFRPCGPDRRGHRRVAPGAAADFWFRR